MTWRLDDLERQAYDLERQAEAKPRATPMTNLEQKYLRGDVELHEPEQ